MKLCEPFNPRGVPINPPSLWVPFVNMTGWAYLGPRIRRLASCQLQVTLRQLRSWGSMRSDLQPTQCPWRREPSRDQGPFRTLDFVLINMIDANDFLDIHTFVDSGNNLGQLYSSVKAPPKRESWICLPTQHHHEVYIHDLPMHSTQGNVHVGLQMQSPAPQKHVHQ